MDRKEDEALEAAAAQWRIDAQRAHGLVGDYAAQYPKESAEHKLARAVGDALSAHFGGGTEVLSELRELRDERRILCALLRRAICDLIEPVGISHISEGTEWRKDADVFIKECRPWVFGKDEAVFGSKR